MSDQDNLRDRLKSRICQQTGCHIDDAEMAAQAIIDEFELTTETRLTEFGIDDPGYQQRVIGEWEESDEQEPRP